MLNAFRTLVALCLATGHAAGQCADWRPNSGLYGTATVYASTIWDPDGAGGPQAPLLVAAGLFSNVTSYDGPVRTNIAAWDGAAWQPLGTGIATSISGWVYDVAVLNGELIAAGHFSIAGGTPANNIARWNGVSWQPLGSGTDGEVHALIVHPTGELFVGGSFTTAGGLPASNIARWNFATQTWSTLGAGVTGTVSALAVMSFGDVIAGGGLTAAAGTPVNRIARWNGSAWFNMNGGLTGGANGSTVAALHVRPNGELIVGGEFTVAGGVSVNNIARWTAGNGGAWQSLGSGVFLGSPTVQCLKEFNGDLIAGGRYIVAGDSTCNGIARWNGSTWSALQGGIPQDSSGNFVMTLAVHNSELFVGGSFPAYNGSNFARSTARWTGSAWLPMPGFIRPQNQFFFDFETFNGKLIIAGQHTSLNTNLPTTSRHLIAWDGVNATEMGNPDAAVNSITTAPSGLSEIVVGGAFTTIGGVSASRIARLAPSQSTQWQTMGAGFNSSVQSVLRHSSDGLYYAAGAFTASGATTLNRVARWNGSAWQALGAGLNGTANCMKVFNGQLYVGGSFTTAGGVSTGGLARWTGSAWQAVAGNFSGTVRSLEVFQNTLIIGGSFPGINNSPSIVAFDGSVLSSLGSGGARDGVGAQATVAALAVVGTNLYAGGTFVTMGGVPTDFLARWDGASWSEVGNGVQDEVRCLHNFNGELQVGGDFALVNNNTVLAPMWARYSETGAPWPALQPVAQTSSCNGSATFTTAAGLGYGTVSYQWRRNGTPLNDGPTGTGSTVSGSATSSLTINAVSGSDIADYTCVLSNACGSATTAIAQLFVPGSIPPNITNHPVSFTACPGGSGFFSVSASTIGTPTYRWRRNGVFLFGSPHYQQVAMPTLLISNITAGEAGQYDCVVTLGCGVSISNPATLSFCSANCDCSQGSPRLTPNDFACFINAYATNSPTANCDGSTGVPLLTPNDFACYINAYANGCP
jgi:hypothetical protein